MIMSNHFCSEIWYGSVHSDLCGTDLSNSEWRNLLHNALNEWLDNSNGEGCFYVGNYPEPVEED
jgi:hypothetical protein